MWWMPAEHGLQGIPWHMIGERRFTHEALVHDDKFMKMSQKSVSSYAPV